MLRRKLLLRLGVLVSVLVIAAVAAIWLLQGVLKDLDHVNADAAALVDGTQELSTALTAVEGELYDRPGHEANRDQLKTAAFRVRNAYAALGLHEITHPQGKAGEVYTRLGALLTPFLAAAEQDADARPALAQSGALRQDVLELVKIARRHVTGERAAIVSRLRFMVMGMSLAALVVVNMAVLLLLRTAEMILRPVDALVEGTRQLAQERFDCRVQLDRDDEFGELANAFNSLAAQLAANEQRKMETLQQTSLMLSHELNNALSIIAMQLTLAERHASGSAAGSDLLKKHLGQIKTSLTRVADTVAALGRVRRIVLTEYLPGQKMLDLPRSIESESATERQCESRNSP
jgi:nitrate/nitrite-specific signal transduction histidine kinase